VVIINKTTEEWEEQEQPVNLEDDPEPFFPKHIRVNNNNDKLDSS